LTCVITEYLRTSLIGARQVGQFGVLMDPFDRDREVMDP